MKRYRTLGRTGLITLAMCALLALVVSVAGAAAVRGAVNVGGVQPEQPAISGSRVVWSDFRQGHWNIWMYDNATKTTTQVTSGVVDKVMPAISGDVIAYVAYSDTSGADVYVYDIANGTSKCVSVDSLGNPVKGDQLNPSISGAYVAWEDYSGLYSQSKIMGYNLSTNSAFIVDSYSSSQMRRPNVSGNIVVYETYPTTNSSTTSLSDVWKYDFSTGVKSAVATSTADERMPVTDGRWIAWMQWDSVSGYDIYAYDTQSGATKVLTAAPGEQALPALGNGMAFWVDAVDGATKVKVCDLSTGKVADFSNSSAGQVAGLSVSGDAAAWLQQIGSRWRVRSLFGTSTNTFKSLSSLLPASPAWSAFRFAVVSAHGDSEPPAVMYASVRAGQRSVSRTNPIRVYFSEDMSAASMSSRNVRLVNAVSHKTVPVRIRYASLSRSVVVTPRASLGSGSYVLMVGKGVKDAAGNTAANDLKVAFSTTQAAAVGVYPPSPVTIQEARVVNTSADVKLSWLPASDDKGVVGYYVKRYTAPIEQANFSSATTLTPVGAGSSLIPSSSVAATFAADVAGQELAKKSTFWYTIYAVDADGMTSQILYNISPDPHGGYVFGKQTINCARCHTVHGQVTGKLGALAARGANACYECHGSTTPATGYGYNSVNNIQAQFWDYSAVTSMPATASRHGNAYIRASDDNQQCDMCHVPHKKPYSDTAASSFTKLLWTPKASYVASWSANASSSVSAPASSYKDYSTDTTPFAETFCLNCHGGSSSYNDTPTVTGGYAFMYVAGGSTAYDNAAGDHNASTWATTTVSKLAHGSVGLPDVTRSTPNGGTQPKINCQVCHNEHGSESASLLDYRRSGVTTQLADAGKLCFKCHTAGGGSAPDAAANNNAWNSRNVQAEFQRTGSTHPISVGVSYGAIKSLATPGTIDTQADFTTWTTPVNVTLTTVPGSAVLDKGETLDPAAAPYVFAKGPLAANYDAYKGSQTVPGVWDSPLAPSTTNAQATGVGSSAFASGGIVYVTRGAGSAVVDKYTPPAGSGTGTWATNAVTLSAVINTGGSSTVKSGANSYAYATAGGSTNTLNWWQIGTTTKGSRTIVNTSNTAMLQGVGSCMAYAPASGRLFLVNINGTSTTAPSDGRLYYATAAPEATTGNLQFTQGPAITQTGGTRYNKMCYFSAGGTDYLAFLGRAATAGAYRLVIVSNLGAASPTVTELAWPFSSTTVGDGADIEWDGAGNLYAVRGNSTEVVRLPIPTDPVNGTWTPETLAAPSFTVGAGSSIAIANADLAAYTDANAYKNSGSLTTSNVTRASGDTTWNTVDYSASVPAGTTLTLNVKDGSTGTDLLGSIPVTGSGSTDISSLSNTSLKFVFTYTTNTGFNTLTPQLDAITIYSSKIGALDTGKSSCYSCHNTHYVGEGSGSAWDVARVSDPANTKSTPSSTTTFCIGCHGSTSPAVLNADGSIGIASIVNATKIIPYGVTMRSTTAWPFFTGWDKGGFTAAAHYSTTGTKALCQNCHDPHASNWDSLLAWTRPASGVTGGNTGSRDNTTTAAREENLCYQCHGDGTTAGRGSATSAPNVYTPATQAYSHTMGAVTGAHSDTELASNLIGANRHSECADCHDVHAAKSGVHTQGSSAAGGALFGIYVAKPTYAATSWTAPSSWSTAELAGSATDYEAYLCLKCHSSYLPNWSTAAPTAPSSVVTGRNYKETDLALDFNPNNASGHNVMGDAFTKSYTKTVGASTFTWGKPTATTLGLLTANGWTVDSQMTCTDCHTYSGTGARGPHGASNRFMLKYGGTTNWYDNTLSTAAWSSTTNFCGGCHTGTGTHPWLNQAGEHAEQCKHCHIAIPHGWKRPRLLRGQDEYQLTGSPYVANDTNDTWRGVTFMAITDQVPSTEANCGDGCDTGKHPITKTTW